MNILGISHPISWNTAACLLIDNQLIAFAEEERFIREKHAPRKFPEQAVKFCLQEASLSPEDIDIVAVGFDFPGHQETERLSGLLEDRLEQLKIKSKIRYYDHHLSHAASAIVPSGFEQANIVTLDGWGGPYSGLLGFKSGHEDIKIFSTVPVESTWGGLWRRITTHMGFAGHSGEGKTMGLASYGKPDESLLPNFIEVNGFPNTEKYFNFFESPKYKTNKLASDDLLSSIIKINTAATLQAYYQDALVKICSNLYEQTKCKILP